MMIQANISAPCAVLDFPTRQDFGRQLKNHQYDIVEITGIIVNLAKVASLNSISSTPRFRGKTPSASSIGPSGATSSSTAQACTAFRKPCWRDSSAAKTIPTRACGNGLRARWEKLSGVNSSALWAMERQFRKVDHNLSVRIRQLRQEFKQESGIVSRMLPALLGSVLPGTTRREEKRLARGKTHEPPTILERSNRVEA